MYKIYVNNRIIGVSLDLEAVKKMGFILAARGHKVAYRKLQN